MKLQFLAWMMPASVILIVLPMIFGKVGPNGIYGFRTPKTMSSPEIWFAANRAAGVAMAVACAVAIVFNLVLWRLHLDWPESKLSVWMSLSLAAAVLLSLIPSFLYLRKL